MLFVCGCSLSSPLDGDIDVLKVIAGGGHDRATREGGVLDYQLLAYTGHRVTTVEVMRVSPDGDRVAIDGSTDRVGHIHIVVSG